jgi:O-antigen/teichoic acid export membrane protein
MINVKKSKSSKEIGKSGLLLAITVGGISFFGGAFLNFIATVLSARLLGPTGRGQLAAIQVIPPFAIFLGCLGHQVALPVLISRKSFSPSYLLSNAFSMGIILFVPILLLSGVVQFFILSNYEWEIQLAGYLFLLNTPFACFLVLCQSCLQGMERFKHFSLLRLLPVISYVIAVITGSIMPGHQIISIATLYLVCVLFICLPINYFYISRLIQSKLFFDLSLRRELGRIGLPYVVSGGFVMLNQSLPQLFISRFLSPADLGLFTVGTAFGAVLSLGAAAVSTVLLPRAAVNHDKPAACGPMLITSCIFPFAVAIFFLIMMPILVHWCFGDKYAVSVGISRILVINYFLISISTVHGNVYRALSYHKVPNICEGAALLLGFVLCAFSAFVFPSLIAMACAWFLGNFLSVLLYLYFDKKFIFPNRSDIALSIKIVSKELMRFVEKKSPLRKRYEIS